MNEQLNEQSRTRPFNPQEHVMKIKNKGGDALYLPVQWRLVWFRNECPQGSIDTQLLYFDPDKEFEEEAYVWNNETRRSEKVIKKACGYAVFRCVVEDGKGGRATGTKMEKAVSFSDYLEKSETGSEGRALAALGYGTQFTDEEFSEGERLADAPVNRGVASGGNANGNGTGAVRKPNIASVRPMVAGPTVSSAQPPEDSNGEATITEQQVSSIGKICERMGKQVPEGLEAYSFVRGKETIAQLTQEYRSRKAS